MDRWKNGCMKGWTYGWDGGWMMTQYEMTYWGQTSGCWCVNKQLNNTLYVCFSVCFCVCIFVCLYVCVFVFLYVCVPFV